MIADRPTDRPGWVLDELTTIGRENLDPTHVSRYDDKEEADAAEEVRLVRSLGVDRSATVVDLGAGTGQFALAAATEFARVVAVDPSPVMLAQLRTTARSQAAPLEIVEGGFLTYDHLGPPADLVYSRFALHHLTDFWKAMALARMRRMLRPGGLVRLWDVVYSFPLDDADDRIERWCATGSSGDGEWTRADLEEHVRDESSTFTWLLEPMITEAGFAIDDATYSEDGFFAKYVLSTA